jgi:MICOS complex subunit MIC19
VPPERQTTLDEQVRSRIQSELKRLREEEENVRRQIESALEKENLDRERSMAGGQDDEAAESTTNSVGSSAALMGDLDEIRSKVDRFHAKRDLAEYPIVKSSGEAVVSCYR